MSGSAYIGLTLALACLSNAAIASDYTLQHFCILDMKGNTETEKLGAPNTIEILIDNQSGEVVMRSSSKLTKVDWHIGINATSFIEELGAGHINTLIMEHRNGKAVRITTLLYAGNVSVTVYRGVCY